MNSVNINTLNTAAHTIRQTTLKCAQKHHCIYFLILLEAYS